MKKLLLLTTVLFVEQSNAMTQRDYDLFMKQYEPGKVITRISATRHLDSSFEAAKSRQKILSQFEDLQKSLAAATDKRNFKKQCGYDKIIKEISKELKRIDKKILEEFRVAIADKSDEPSNSDELEVIAKKFGVSYEEWWGVGKYEDEGMMDGAYGITEIGRAFFLDKVKSKPEDLINAIVEAVKKNPVTHKDDTCDDSRMRTIIWMTQ